MLNTDAKDAYWTGAKAVADGGSSKEVGITRLKCGRSDIKDEQRSESMSCSDKILKWNAVGLQGALLSNLIERPLHLSSITVETPWHGLDNERVFLRGLTLHHRIPGIQAKSQLFLNEPLICLVPPAFKRGRYLSEGSPVGHSVAWNLSEPLKVTTIIGKFGLKQGANVKNKKGLKGFRTDICDYELAAAFGKLRPEAVGRGYEELKKEAKRYREACEAVKGALVGGWTERKVKTFLVP